ncbi:MAG: tRNA (N6-isopentenyl adenosine(37)-C2)-methylthiotransferase MiaB [Candidatus Muiribacteriota bacterium]
MKAIIMTYGCQMNELDSEVARKYLKDEGYDFTEDLSEADLILINTCCVRESAEKRIYGRANWLKRYKYKNPALIIGVIGCLAQKDKQEVFKKIPHADFVLGPQEVKTLPEVLKKVKMGKKYIGHFYEKEYISEGDRVVPLNPFKAWLSIMKGCDNYCSYCIVPYVRGHEVSKPYEIIEDEFRYLHSIGMKDVTLLGQNVNSYGKGMEEDINFSKLLQKLDKLNLIPRIRFVTSHPKDFSFELADTIKNGKNLCPHIHLPFQAGSNKILKEMNRKYTIENYMEKIDYIKKNLPNASITTDIIVGFPGETEEDFNHTMDVVKKVRFDSAHTFIYSERSGTKAATYDNKVPEEVKKERIKHLIEVQNEISLEINQKMKNVETEILIEGVDKKGDFMQGRTTSNKIVLIPYNQKLMGEIVKVRITEGLHWTLYGELI